MFNTVEEISLKLSKSHMLNPYGLVAFELGDGQADGGDNKGTYLELGVGPAWSLSGGKATVTVPVKVGLSVKDYYEVDGEDKKFGFFDVGGLLTYPLTGVSANTRWNIHGGVDYLYFGDESFTGLVNVNSDFDEKSSNVVGIFGIGVSY